MPTILEWAGIEVPPGVQGKSLAPLVAGSAAGWRKNTIWVDDRESPELKANGVDPTGFRVMALRSKHWKYVHYAGRPYGELYDLAGDPDEYENLWNEPRFNSLRSQCRDQLLETILANHDPLPLREFVY